MMWVGVVPLPINSGKWGGLYFKRIPKPKKNLQKSWWWLGCTGKIRSGQPQGCPSMSKSSEQFHSPLGTSLVTCCTPSHSSALFVETNIGFPRNGAVRKRRAPKLKSSETTPMSQVLLLLVSGRVIPPLIPENKKWRPLLSRGQAVIVSQESTVFVHFTRFVSDGFGSILPIINYIGQLWGRSPNFVGRGHVPSSRNG